MNITQEQKDILISIIEKTKETLTMDESMEYGEDINTILNEIKNEKKEVQ